MNSNIPIARYGQIHSLPPPIILGDMGENRLIKKMSEMGIRVDSIILGGSLSRSGCSLSQIGSTGADDEKII